MSNLESIQQLKALGDRVRSLRLDARLSQSDLGARINKEQTSIQRLESGKINPSYLYLRDISEGLEISIDVLLKGL